jgi:carbon storage regulator
MIGVCRKVGERLRIGNQIVITIVAIRGQQVHLKVNAPESMAVWREEAYREKGITPATEETVEICTWLGQVVLREVANES